MAPPPRTSRRSPAERKRIAEVLARLHEAYPDPRCALHHRNAFQLLVATILSAQCTDERVNIVTPGLFAKWGTPAELAAAPTPLLEAEIRSTGFFRNKTRNLQGCARELVQRFGGKVPRTMAELVTLPGVARKTANVVLGTAFGSAAGIVVDTHVARLSQRLGLSRHAQPEKIEQDLMAVVPREDWIWVAHALIHHGRDTCRARRPACERCPLAEVCPAGQKFLRAAG
jgi:endonuclease-3